MRNLDPQALQALADLQRAGMPDLVARAIGIFKTDWPNSVFTIEQALTENDLKTVRFAAHTLKSNSAHVGAALLVDLCAEIEYAARDENADFCSNLATKLNDLFSSYCIDLDRHMEKAA